MTKESGHNMTKEDARQILWELDFTAGMSTYYYRWLANWLAGADRLLRIATGLATVFGLAVAFAPTSNATAAAWGFALAVISAITATLMNVLPLDAFERRFRVLLTRWKEFQADLQLIEVDQFGRPLDAAFIVQTMGRLSGEVSPAGGRDIQRAMEKKHAISSDETFDIDWLARMAQGAETVRRWGAGIKTGQQVKDEFAKRRAEYDAEQKAIADAAKAA